MAPVVLLLVALVAVLALGMVRAPLWAWAVSVGVLTLLATGGSFDPESWIAWLPFLALAVLSIPAVRRSLIIAPVFAQIRKILPKVSDTEAQALEAGTVGFDAELFQGVEQILYRPLAHPRHTIEPIFAGTKTNHRS